MNNTIDKEVESAVLKIFSREEVFEKSLIYFNGDELAAQVWINKYALKDSEGNLYELTPDDMHKRIAKEFARIEQKYENPLSEEEIYDLIKKFKYIVPQGSPMAGIGNNFQYVSLSNCFVIGNDPDSDSYGGILKLDQELVQLQKRRAGVGLDLSFIRPRGTTVKNSALTSTGVVPYMERFSNSTREVAQDGRRGALMESFSIVHPDAEEFIDAKMDEKKVTGANVSVRISDDFMEAALKGVPFKAQYPVDSKNPISTKEVNAEALWKKIIHNAWKRAEPGILFWDTIIKESIPDCYSDLGFRTTSTNPCVVGDTMVAVADGRHSLSIKQLAEEGKDVPVYTLNENGKVCIRYMRNPRITGYNEPIYKVTIEEGFQVRVTGNHKFRLKDGSYKEAKDLKCGDSLYVMSKYEASLKEIFPESNSNSQDYMWINHGKKNSFSEHRLIAEFYNNKKIQTGYVVHHKDYNALNNKPENLKIMSRVDHDKLHSYDKLGDKNPMRRAKTEWSKEKWQQYHNNMSDSVSGELNGKFSGFSEEDIRNAALELTKKLNRRFSTKEWKKFAKENGLPQMFSGWRNKQLNGNIHSLSNWSAKELGFDNFIGVDPRLVKTYYEMLDQGYDAKIVNHQVIITKKCEACDNEINIEHRRREVSVCSKTCHNTLMHKNLDIKNKIKESRLKTEKERKEKIAENQIKLFSELKFNLQRQPMRKEWENFCKQNNVSPEIGRKTSPIRKWDELVEMGNSFNHKVISVELDGVENVYNGTVDEFHNFFIGNFESKTLSNKHKWLYINNLQCGEITLCNDDSCRLLCINLYSYVENPFTDKAKFNWKLFEDHAIKSQRLMDDLIDLELEKIDKILDKIDSDPESEFIKSIEKNLWLNIKNKCEQGRRTGLGITAEGDMLAALGITYGTDKANDFSEKLHKVLKLSSYRSSVILAKERGSFPIFDIEREKNNPFIKRIQKEDNDLFEDMKKYGRRNIALLTIAPTGSVSIMTQTTSGIEPAFLISYMRRRKINPNDKNARVDFVDPVGDSWQNYPVFHHKFIDYLKTKGYNDLQIENLQEQEIQNLIQESPYYKATSNDVDWVKKVEMQGRVQKHIDHSISVTVNLPNNVSEETVSKVYETGWRSGCKGLTVYRDGSRSGVLVSNEQESKEEENKKKFSDHHAPKRPKFLDADVYRFMNKGEKWIAFVGLMDGRPYEIFTGIEESFTIPKNVEKGVIRRMKLDDEKSRYDFIINHKTDDVLVVEGLSAAFDPQYHNYAKMFSGILRHGMPLEYVVELIEKLNLDEDRLDTWKNGVMRTIKKYIKDGTKVKNSKCPNQDPDCAMQYSEGCLSCPKCGLSKCG